MTDISGWRKRQIALDQKAENARELGLDYKPRGEEHMNNDDNVPIVLVWIFAAFCAATVYGITYLAFLL